MSGASDRLYLIVHGVAVPAPFLTTDSPPPLSPPGQPVGLSATPGVTTMLLAWSPPATGGATGYRVARDGSVVATPAGSPWTDTALTASSSHTWTVHATGPGGVSATGASVTQSTLATPPRPTLANTGPTPGSVTTIHTGDYVASADGAVVSGLHITGHLYIAASDVLVVDCQVDGDVAINALPGGGQVVTKARQTIRRVAARRVENPGGFDTLDLDTCRFGLDGVDDTVSQLVDSASRPAHGLTCRNSYFYGRPAWRPDGPHGAGWDPHWEAIHWVGLTGMVVENNVFDYQAKADAYAATTKAHITAAITFERSWTGSGRTPSGVFSGNWIRGGGAWFQVYLNLSGGSVVNGNDFEVYEATEPVRVVIADPDFTASGNTRTNPSTGAVTPLPITY